MNTPTLLTLLATTVLLNGCALANPPQAMESNNTKTNTQTEQPTNTQPIEPVQTNETLDLSNQNLQKIPASVFNQKNLEELNVSHNQLTGAIQAEIRHLQNLQVLNASYNAMTGVPAEIGQLSNLQILDLSNNQLTGLPYELGNLHNLKTLNISGNNYSEADLSVIQEKLPKDVQIMR